jgi:hypothetical protein
MDIKDMGTIVAVVISAAAFVNSFKLSKHTTYTTENEYTKNLVNWYSAVVEVLIRLRLSIGKLSEADRIGDLARLSSLIECGRFYFPNIDKKDGYGKEKPLAFQGYRNLVLDYLVASFNILKRKEDLALYSPQLTQLQRHFTSVIFEVVMPSERLAKLEILTGKYFADQKIFEDFERTGDASLIEHIWPKRQ